MAKRGRGRKYKRQFARKPVYGVCSCTSHGGEPKTLFSEHWQASRRAGDTMGDKMWQVYKCPYPDSDGWHIATVRWDPWNSSVYRFPEEAL